MSHYHYSAYETSTQAFIFEGTAIIAGVNLLMTRIAGLSGERLQFHTHKLVLTGRTHIQGDATRPTLIIAKTFK